MTAKYNYYILLDRVICGRLKKYKGAKYIHYFPPTVWLVAKMTNRASRFQICTLVLTGFFHFHLLSHMHQHYRLDIYFNFIRPVSCFPIANV